MVTDWQWRSATVAEPYQQIPVKGHPLGKAQHAEYACHTGHFHAVTIYGRRHTDSYIIHNTTTGSSMLRQQNTNKMEDPGQWYYLEHCDDAFNNYNDSLMKLEFKNKLLPVIWSSSDVTKQMIGGFQYWNSGICWRYVVSYPTDIEAYRVPILYTDAWRIPFLHRSISDNYLQVNQTLTINDDVSHLPAFRALRPFLNCYPHFWCCRCRWDFSHLTRIIFRCQLPLLITYELWLELDFK